MSLHSVVRVCKKRLTRLCTDGCDEIKESYHPGTRRALGVQQIDVREGAVVENEGFAKQVVQQQNKGLPQTAYATSPVTPSDEVRLGISHPPTPVPRDKPKLRSLEIETPPEFEAAIISPLEALTPMLVMPLAVFKQQEELPCSTAAMRSLATSHGALIKFDSAVHIGVFISHHWWHRPAKATAAGGSAVAPGGSLNLALASSSDALGLRTPRAAVSEQAGRPDHPDGDKANLKWRVLCAALDSLVEMRNLDAARVVVWLDWLSLPQDDTSARRDGMLSLISYVTRCEYMLVPTQEEKLTAAARKHPENLPVYGKRAWCRCEYFIFALWAEMKKGQPEVQMYAATVNGALLHYHSLRVLGTAALPSVGDLSFEGDRAVIKQLERAILRDFGEASALRVCAAASGAGSPAVLHGLMLSAESVPAVAAAMRLHAVTAADLSSNELGAAGARTLALELKLPPSRRSPKRSPGAVRQSGSPSLRRSSGSGAGLPALTSLDVRHNAITGEAAHELATAVAGMKSIATFGGIELVGLRSRAARKLALARMGLGPVEALVVTKLAKRNRELHQLDMSFNRIGPEGAAGIGTLLSSDGCGLARLTLHVNNIGSDGVRSIADGLRTNQTMRILEMAGSPYEGIAIGNEGVAALADAIGDIRTLTVLDLRANDIGAAGATALCAALQRNLKLLTLNLRSNRLGPKGAAALSSALQVNGTLKTLIVSQNSLGDGGGIAIAEALQVFSTITRVDLSGNTLGPEAAAAVSKALSVNTVLKSLSLDDNILSAKGGMAIAAALYANRTLSMLDTRANDIKGEAARRLALSVLDSVSLEEFGGVPLRQLRAGRLTELDLNRKKLGPAEGIVLARLVKKVPALVSLSVVGDPYKQSNGIGTDGGKAMLELLRAETALAHLNLTSNSLDEDVKAALKATAAERNVNLEI